MKIEFLLSKEQKAAALECERRWQAWLRDPDHNAAPNRKANAATAQREYKAVGGGGRTLEYTTGAFHFEWSARGERRTPTTPAEPAEPADPLGNTMIQRANAAMTSILRERADDPEPTWADAIGRAYWARREEQRRARMSHWRQYLP